MSHRWTDAPIVASNPLGVASGDPLCDAVVLWTRLLPAGGLPAVDVDVEWEVATDAELTDIAASGSAPAVAALGHSVHVDVTGLKPDTEYHYRFRVAGFESPVGRTRTFAAAGTMPERFTFAYSSCQSWEHGCYAAAGSAQAGAVDRDLGRPRGGQQLRRRVDRERGAR